MIQHARTAAVAALSVLLASCTVERANAPSALVSVEELPAELARGGADVVVLDARDAASYAAGHVTGALRVELDAWESLSLAADTGLDHESAWRERIGALGIDGDDAVFVYDGGKMTQAARLWFILQHFGVARAAVVDGGFPLIAEAAQAGRLELSTEPSSRRATRFEPARAGSVGLLDRAAVKAAIERGEVQVLDARSEDEYRGLDLKKNARGGHLPGAVNLPHTRLLDQRGQLQPVPELDRLLAGAGFERGRTVITHCDGGGRAALAALAAARAGYGPVLNYYLSFGDWAKDATCPVEQP